MRAAKRLFRQRTRDYLNVLEIRHGSRTSRPDDQAYGRHRGHRVGPLGDIRLRDPLLDGWRSGHDNEVGGVSSRSVPSTRWPDFSVIPTVP